MENKVNKINVKGGESVDWAELKFMYSCKIGDGDEVSSLSEQGKKYAGQSEKICAGGYSTLPNRRP